MRHFKRATSARGRRGYRYNLQLPSFPPRPGGTIKQFMTILAVSQSVSQSVRQRSPPLRLRARRPRPRGRLLRRPHPARPPTVRGDDSTAMRHCIVAKTYEARNKIYAVVFLNAKRARLAGADKSCLSICERPRFVHAHKGSNSSAFIAKTHAQFGRPIFCPCRTRAPLRARARVRRVNLNGKIAILGCRVPTSTRHCNLASQDT